ncbi:MAG: SufD family Fe-S cluster assembly protein [archaeon]
MGELTVRVNAGEHLEREIDVPANSDFRLFLEKGASARLVAKFFGESGKTTQRIELAPGSQLALCEIKKSEAGGEFSSEITIAKGAKFLGLNSVVSGGRVGEKREIFLAGKGASADYSEIFWENGEERLESNLLIVHSERDTSATAHSRGLVSGGGSARARGLVRIEKRAQKANSFLSQHAMLLDSESRNDSLPFLEIEANDVKARHSAAAGPIDPEQVFYLQSRGLSREEAIRTIALGFLLGKLPGFESIPGDDSALSSIERLFGEKWRRSIEK